MDIKKREDKIKDKRKQTPWRDFVKEICSRSPVSMGKNKSMISIYPETDRVKVIEHHEYQKLRDELTNKPMDFNGNKSFFQKLYFLMQNVGLPSVVNFFENENADYASPVAMSKNAYLSFGVIGSCENVLYGYSIKDHSTDIYNSVMVRDNSSVVYNSSAIFNSFKIFFSKNINNSNNISNCINMQGCSECISCNNLENKSYHINNIKYAKEEYLNLKKNILSKNSFESHSDIKLGNFGSTNISNCECVIKSHDIENGIFSYQTHNARNIGFCGSEEGNEDLYDTFFFGSPSGNKAYGMVAGGAGIENVYCSHLINGGNSIFYSIYLESCSYCLGCVGLINKQFCIFNKEYSKEERFESADKIFAQMEEERILGNFFPGWMNPFYFNDTAAYLIDDSLTKEEVAQEGYLRREGEIKVDIPEGADVIESSDLGQYQGFDSEGTWKINSEILKKVIKDEKGNYYRIVQMEYDFLIKHSLPLPELHRLERIKLGFKFK